MPAQSDTHAFERACALAYMHVYMYARTIRHSRFRTRLRPCIHARKSAQSGAPAFESAHACQPSHTDAHAVEHAHKLAYVHVSPHNRTLTLSNAPAPLHTCMSARTIRRSRFRRRHTLHVSPHQTLTTLTLSNAPAPLPTCMSARTNRRSRVCNRAQTCMHRVRQPKLAYTRVRAFTYAHASLQDQLRQGTQARHSSRQGTGQGMRDSAQAHPGRARGPKGRE